jgi:hypothetical protein
MVQFWLESLTSIIENKHGYVEILNFFEGNGSVRKCVGIANNCNVLFNVYRFQNNPANPGTDGISVVVVLEILISRLKYLHGFH